MFTRTNYHLAIATLVIFTGGCDNCGRGIGSKPDAAVQPDVAVTPDAAADREIEYTVISYTGDINVGDTEVDLLKVRMENHSDETAMIDVAAFTMWHFPWMDIANAKLLVSGVTIETENDNSVASLTLNMDLISDYALEPGAVVNFILRGDIVDGICGSLDARFDDEYTFVFGAASDLPFTLYPSPQSDDVFERDVTGLGYNFRGPIQLPPEDVYVPAGSANVTVLEFTLQSNFDSEIRAFELEVFYTIDTWAYLHNVRLMQKHANGEWYVAADSIDLNPSNCQDASCVTAVVEFYDTFGVEGNCTINEYMITMDIDIDAPPNIPFRVSLHGDSIEAYDTSQNPISSPGNTVQGSFMHVVAI